MRVVLALLLAGGMVVGLAACGKRGAPQAPGPSDQVIYPKTYPVR